MIWTNMHWFIFGIQSNSDNSNFKERQLESQGKLKKVLDFLYLEEFQEVRFMKV